MHIGEAEVAALEAIRQFRVIEAEQVQQRRVQVVDVDLVLRGVEAEFVGFAKREAGFDPAGSFLIARQRRHVGDLGEDVAQILGAATLGAGFDVFPDFPGGELCGEGESHDLIEADPFTGRGVRSERGQIIRDLGLNRFHQFCRIIAKNSRGASRLTPSARAGSK